MRRNPAAADAALVAIAPILPYAVAGLVLYFFGDKIFAYIGSRLTGRSYEQYKQDMQTTKQAIAHPVEGVKDFTTAIKVATTGYITQAEAKKMQAETNKRLGIVAGVKIPYPQPQSIAEFRANIEAINKAKGWKK